MKFLAETTKGKANLVFADAEKLQHYLSKIEGKVVVTIERPKKPVTDLQLWKLKIELVGEFRVKAWEHGQFYTDEQILKYFVQEVIPFCDTVEGLQDLGKKEMSQTIEAVQAFIDQY